MRGQALFRAVTSPTRSLDTNTVAALQLTADLAGEILTVLVSPNPRLAPVTIASFVILTPSFSASISSTLEPRCAISVPVGAAHNLQACFGTQEDLDAELYV